MKYQRTLDFEEQPAIKNRRAMSIWHSLPLVRSMLANDQFCEQAWTKFENSMMFPGEIIKQNGTLSNYGKLLSQTWWTALKANLHPWNLILIIKNLKEFHTKFNKYSITKFHKNQRDNSLLMSYNIYRRKKKWFLSSRRWFYNYHARWPDI